VHQDVRNVLRVLREAEKSILIQGRKVEQAKRSVEAEKIRFERGLKDSFDVITAEDNLLSAKREFINRTIEYVVRLDELQLVIGAPTGRVDLTAKSQGGQLRTGPPVTLTPERTPKSSEQPDRAIKDRY
jgi:outer membrane protein TolC